MGNTASAPNGSTQESHTESNITTLPYLIDEIAMHYMLTQNSIELIKISDKEYYDNLIILTSNVIEKRLNNLEIGYLKNRITGNSEQIEDILPANSKIKDKVVMDISKFYIKIVMIYSAIASTFDPQYSYSDETGEKSFYLKDFEEYKNIPKNVKPQLVQLTNPLSLCRKRLNILKNRYDDTSEPGSIILNPGEKLCSTESSVKLTDEIGIKELDSLYYDLFDYNTKTWSKRSNKMKKKYNKDLILFYRIFTGKKNKPANIKSFQDIELLDFKTLNSCSDNTFLSDIVISNENKLVKQYKEKIDLIQSSTEDNRNQLYSILKELFIIKIVDNEQSYTINPSLTLDKILLLEEQTRNIILDLYISCEKYFIQALIIFENIYESKDYTVSELRKENLMKIQEEIVAPNYKNTLIIPPFSPNISYPELFSDKSRSPNFTQTSITEPSPQTFTAPSEQFQAPEQFQSPEPFQAPQSFQGYQQFQTPKPFQAPSTEPQLVEESPVQESQPFQISSTEPQPVEEPLVQESPVQESQPAEESPVQESQPLEESTLQESQPLQESLLQESQPVQESPAQESQLVEESTLQESQPVQESTLQESNPSSLPNSQAITETFTKAQSNNLSKQELNKTEPLASNSQMQTKESINFPINKPQSNETIKATNPMNGQNKIPFQPQSQNQSHPQNQIQNLLKNTSNSGPINSNPKNISFPGKSNTFTEPQKPRFNTK